MFRSLKILLRTIIISLILLFSSQTFAEVQILNLEVLREDSLIVIRPEIIDPFSAETQQTLQSGIPVAVDLDVQFIRTGYVKHLDFTVKVEYNVWSDLYRITTPIGPLAIKDYNTLISFFKNDLILTTLADNLPGNTSWLVKVRAGDRRVLVVEDSGDAVQKIEKELSGIAKWLFKRGKKKNTFGEWSSLKQLPKYRDNN
jgi:hypothetical protein